MCFSRVKSKSKTCDDTHDDFSITGRKIFNKKNLSIFFITLLLYTLMALIKSYNGDSKLWLRSDATGYYQIAYNLAKGHGFSRCGAEPYLPDTIRTPIYPLFISAFVLLFQSPADVTFAVFAQCLLASFILVILYNYLRIFSKKEDEVFSVIATILFGLSPIYISSILVLYSEVLFSLFYITFLLFLHKALQYGLPTQIAFTRREETEMYGLPIAVGFALGVLTLIRPITQFLFVVPCSFFVLKKYYTRSLLIVLMFSLKICPWLARNYYYYNKVALSSLGFRDLYHHSIRLLIKGDEINKYIKGDMPHQISCIIQDKDGTLLFPPKNGHNISLVGIGYFGFEHEEIYKRLSLSILKDKWKEFLLLVIKNPLGFITYRGPNILTDIFVLDYKYYRNMPLGEKIFQFNFIVLMLGFVYEYLYRFLFYTFVFIGIIFSIKSKTIMKDMFLLSLLLSAYFIVLISATIADNFDLSRLILPVNLTLTIFIPIAAKKILSPR